jgi:O-succinylhomoserine sulfhydrylase
MSAPAKKYRPETRLIHAGTLRSPFGETSEALYLTQGYVYESSLQAEKRFKNEEPGYQYSRFSNPTVTMFEQRMASLEGAEAARATATGMAAVTTAIMGQLRAGDHVVASKALFGSCRYVVEEHCPRYGIACTLVDGTDLAQWKKAVRPNTKTFFLESPTNPALEVLDIREIAKIAHAAGATLVVDNVFSTPLPAAARARRRLRGVLGHQAHRRPGPLPRRRHPGVGEVHRGQRADADPADRALTVAVQRLGAAEGSGDAGGAGAAPD